MTLEKLQDMGIEYGTKVVGALLILIIGMWVVKAIKTGIVRVMQKKEVDPTLISFLGSLAAVTMKAFVIIAALNVLKIPTASFVAVLGAAGLAVGLALQGSLFQFCRRCADDYFQAD